MRIVALLVSLLYVGVAGATDITTCHQTINAGDTGTLQADLACDSTSPDVTLQAGARLELNGHTISGGYLGVGVDPGGRKTTIEGPGEIFGISGSGGISGCGIATQAKALIQNVQIHDSGCGIVAVYTYPMVIEGVTITNVTGNGIGFTAPVKHGRVKVDDSTITGSGGNGILAHHGLVLRNVTVTGSALAGAFAVKKFKARDSTLTGNGPDGDVASFLRPNLINCTCDHSVNSDGAGNWGVCALDLP